MISQLFWNRIITIMIWNICMEVRNHIQGIMNIIMDIRIVMSILMNIVE